MYELLKTNRDEFLKDPKTGALINNDNLAFQQFKNKREEVKSLNNMKLEINNLREDINLIMKILKKANLIDG